MNSSTDMVLSHPFSILVIFHQRICQCVQIFEKACFFKTIAYFNWNIFPCSNHVMQSIQNVDSFFIFGICQRFKYHWHYFGFVTLTIFLLTVESNWSCLTKKIQCINIFSNSLNFLARTFWHLPSVTRVFFSMARRFFKNYT